MTDRTATALTEARWYMADLAKRNEVAAATPAAKALYIRTFYEVVATGEVSEATGEAWEALGERIA